MTTNTGGPAFPGLHPSKECHYQDAGMSLRDFFAAKAMQGLISNGGSSHKEVAQAAYIVADAMLKEREQK
jgi:hypothetical protein